MSTEQVGQLYELMHATKDVWRASLAQQSVDEVAGPKQNS